jgi:phasin family protein
MLSNKKNCSSASVIFFQSLHPNWSDWARSALRAAEKMTELNVAAANALAAESRAAWRQCLLADSPPALMALALTQAQAGVAKARSYARHWRGIVFSIGGDELAAMKNASRKWSMSPQSAEKKLPAVAGAALTLSDCVDMATGGEVSGVKLASVDVADATDVTDCTDFTEISNRAARLAIRSLDEGR